MISDANSKNIISREIIEQIEIKEHIENLIWDLSSANFNEVLKLILNLKNIDWLQKLICCVAPRRPFSYKLYADLFQKTGKSELKMSSSFSFHYYLFKRGLVNLTDIGNNKYNLTVENFEKPIPKDTIWDYIYHNDLQKFLKYIAEHDITFEQTKFYLFGWEMYILDFACFCDAIDIVKYLYINDVQINRRAVIKAVQGGSESTIYFLESKGFQFDDCLLAAIQFHRNEIGKWLYEYYIDGTNRLAACVQYFNTEMYIFLSTNSKPCIEEKDYTNMTPLMYAAKNDDISLVSYLLRSGVTRNKPALSRLLTKEKVSDEMRQILGI